MTVNATQDTHDLPTSNLVLVLLVLGVLGAWHWYSDQVPVGWLLTSERSKLSYLLPRRQLHSGTRYTK